MPKPSSPLIKKNLKIASSPPLLPLSVPLFNPSSALLTPFPHRTPPLPRTAMPPPSNIAVIPPMPLTAPPSTASDFTTVAIAIAITIVPPVMGAHTPTPAPASASASAPTLTPPVAAISPKELPPQIPPNELHMHEITVTATVTVVFLKLTARCFAKIGNGREIGNDRATGVEATLQSLQGSSGLIFLLELDIDVANHVIG